MHNDILVNSFCVLELFFSYYSFVQSSPSCISYAEYIWCEFLLHTNITMAKSNSKKTEANYGCRVKTLSCCLYVTDYNVYDSFCIWNLHVAVIIASSIEPYSGSVCRFVSVVWSICWCRNLLYFWYNTIKCFEIPKNGKFSVFHAHTNTSPFIPYCLRCILSFWLWFISYLCTIFAIRMRCIQIKIDFCCFVLCKWIWFCRLKAQLWHSIYVRLKIIYFRCIFKSEVISTNVQIWGSGVSIVYFWLHFIRKNIVQIVSIMRRTWSEFSMLFLS